MPFVPAADAMPHVLKAKMALGLTNRTLGEAMNASTRTVVRWWGHHAFPHATQIATLVRLVYPKDANLAANLAVHCGQTLESLGLRAPAAQEAALAAQQAALLAAKPALPPGLLVHAVVGAAADAMNAPPSAAKGAVLAAFSAARALGLSLEDVESALRAG